VAIDSIVFSFIAVVVAGDVVVLAVSVAAVPKRVPSVRPAFGVLITLILIRAVVWSQYVWWSFRRGGYSGREGVPVLKRNCEASPILFLRMRFSNSGANCDQQCWALKWEKSRIMVEKSDGELVG
jgi:hypothetical protein